MLYIEKDFNTEGFISVLLFAAGIPAANTPEGMFFIT